MSLVPAIIVAIHNNNKVKRKKNKDVEVLRCPYCGAPVEFEQKQCDYCGHYLVWYNNEIIDIYEEKPPEKEIEHEPREEKRDWVMTLLKIFIIIAIASMVIITSLQATNKIEEIMKSNESFNIRYEDYKDIFNISIQVLGLVALVLVALFVLGVLMYIAV